MLCGRAWLPLSSAFAVALAVALSTARFQIAFLEFGFRHDLWPWIGIPSGCLLDWEESAKRHAHGLMIISDDENVTYKQMDLRVHALAAELRLRFGIKPGDVVVAAIDMRPEGMATHLACHLLGAIYAPVTFDLQTFELERILKALGPVACAVVSPGLAESSWRSVFSKVFVVGEENGRLAAKAGSRVSQHRWSIGDTAALIATSGSTGEPKFVDLPLRAFTSTGAGCQAKYTLLLSAGWEAISTVYLSFEAAHTGTTIVITKDHAGVNVSFAAARRWADLIVRHNVSGLMLYPPMAVSFTSVDIVMPSVHKLVLSGQPPNKEVCSSIMHLFPRARWYHAYGMTESGKFGSAYVMNPGFGPFTSYAFKSVGKWDAHIGAIRIVYDRSTDDVDCPHALGSKVGEIYMRSVYRQFKGYWRNPSATAAAVDWRSYIHTGDLGCTDPEGNLYIVGRKNVVIKHRITGKKIFPTAVEAALQSITGVLTAGVVGRPAPAYGEEVIACVVKKNNLSAAAIWEHLDGILPAWQMPDKIYFMDNLPMTNTGKVARKQLKQIVAGLE